MLVCKVCKRDVSSKKGTFCMSVRPSVIASYCKSGAGHIRRIFLFPHCVARVPVSLWGLWGSGGMGVEGLFARPGATVRYRSRPFATVCECPETFASEVAMVVPMVGKFCKRGHLRELKRRAASFCVAGRVIQTCFVGFRIVFTRQAQYLWGAVVRR